MEFDLDLSLDMLRRTPATLEALLDAAAEGWVRATEGAGTFSPFDVVGHLIDGEETDWIPRARIILARGKDPRFEPYDRFRHRARNADRSLTSLLTEFARLRAANLELLRSWRLTAAELGSAGRSPEPRAASPFASCWQPGWLTTWGTWPRSHGSWRSSTARRSGHGFPTRRS